MASRVQGVVVAQRKTLGPFQCHNPTAGHVPLDRGQLKPWVLRGVCCKFRSSRRFEPQVQFSHDHTFKMRDHVHGPQPTRRWRQKLNHVRRKVEGVDILAEVFLDVWAQHFDCNGFPCLRQLGLVNLRNRRGSDRFAEFRKQRIDGDAQFGFDHSLGFGNRERRQLVLQNAQLLCHLVTHNIGACAEHLTELDIGRAQRRQRTRGRGHGWVTVVTKPFERPAKQPRGKAQRFGRIERIKNHAHRTRTFQRRARTDQAQDIVRSSHVRFSSPNADRRCPCLNCGTWHSRTRPAEPCQGTCPDRETCGSIRQGTDSCHGHSRWPAPGAE